MTEISIPPLIVHKDSVDDVLINRPRTPLPLSIFKKDVNLDSYLLQFLGDYYVEYGDQLQVDISEKIKQNMQIITPAKGDEFSSNSWSERRAVPFQVVTGIDLESDSEVDRKRKAIKALFNTVPGLLQASSFELINLADNYFFYRKQHEHVPGTMLIEAARQATYHHIYSLTSFVHGSVTITVDEINTKFLAYVELMYPIEIVVDTIEQYKSDKPRKALYRASFYQRGKMVATVDSKVSLIEISLFKKIRNIFLYEDDWYRPINQAWLECKVLSDCGREFEVELVAVSKTGCITSLVSDINYDKTQSLSITLSGGSKVFQAEITVIELNKKSFTWSFKSLGFESVYDLGEIIKRSFVQYDQDSENIELAQ